MHEYSACMYVRVTHVPRGQKTLYIPKLELQMELPWGCWDRTQNLCKRNKELELYSHLSSPQSREVSAYRKY